MGSEAMNNANALSRVAVKDWRIRSLLFLILCLVLLVGHCAVAQEHARAAVSGQTLVVGTKLAPPFVMKSDGGPGYTGLSIQLWEAVADKLDITYRYEQHSLKELFGGLEDGHVDIAVAALTVTAQREARVDFAYPFFTTGLAIAVPVEGNAVWSALSRMLSWQFFVAVMTLVAFLFVAGALVWSFERRRNAEEFGGSVAHGLAEGFWWAAVTMTTVGYGDRSPRTPGGRIIGLIWMFTALIVVSSLTAAIATSLTVGQLKTRIHNVGDLPGARVATVQESSAAEELAERGIGYTVYSDIGSALDALGSGRTDAVVYDAPILHHAVLQGHAGSIQVLRATFGRQDYAFALPAHSNEFREALDRAILSYLKTPEWAALKKQYLGKP